MNKKHQRSMIVTLLLAALFLPAQAGALDFRRIVVFGTSLSDPGNAFALTGQSIKKPYSELDDFLIPPAPYAAAGYHFSNGQTWVEQLARRLDLGDDTAPAFGDSETATNYAVGGARARSDGLNLNLPDQVAVFLADVEMLAPADALYIIDMGANDVRDALLVALLIGSAAASEEILADALASIDTQIRNLYGAGARKFLVLNVPNLGVLPSIQMLDSVFPGTAGFAASLSIAFNTGLDNVIAPVSALPYVEVKQLNLHRKVNELIASPAQFGLREVSAPCITPDVRPFACKRPDQFVFWTEFIRPKQSTPFSPRKRP